MKCLVSLFLKWVLVRYSEIDVSFNASVQGFRKLDLTKSAPSVVCVSLWRKTHLCIYLFIDVKDKLHLMHCSQCCLVTRHYIMYGCSLVCYT